MTPNQLEALSTLKQNSDPQIKTNQTEFMGGLMGVLSKNWAIPNQGPPPYQNRDLEGSDSEAKESTGLVPKIKTKFNSAVKASNLENLVKTVKEANIPLRTLAAIGGVAMVTISVLSFLGYFFTLSILLAVFQAYQIAFGLLIFALETRSFFHTLLKKMRVFEYFKILSVSWGRGIFYIYCGSLILGAWNLVNILLGVYLIIVGLLFVIFGVNTVSKLKSLQKRFTNEDQLRQIFEHYDVDNSGALDKQELASLCYEMGAELSRNELETALHLLDRDEDGLIQFEEFIGWWKAFQVASCC
eukprot:CAMPEP_0171458924 /NCGR_PEP_ID=MMETSP0945-20130129/4408_1 /TAXON_ID=109269 /ORGANISM="Vaucheria litorea, Strain CCMP2940" /LENGTH=299 /DNA_ID=CAMNT_0011984829 /DNA_START=88 /DNA_END=987 /DNA_ORIENTATION=+